MGEFRINYDILKPERLTTTNIALTVLAGVLGAIPGALGGLFVDYITSGDNARIVGAGIGAVAAINLATGFISYEPDEKRRQ